jgi:hypothetical protein
MHGVVKHAHMVYMYIYSLIVCMQARLFLLQLLNALVGRVSREHDKCNRSRL